MAQAANGQVKFLRGLPPLTVKAPWRALVSCTRDACARSCTHKTCPANDKNQSRGAKKKDLHPAMRTGEWNVLALAKPGYPEAVVRERVKTVHTLVFSNRAFDSECLCWALECFDRVSDEIGMRLRVFLSRFLCPAEVSEASSRLSFPLFSTRQMVHFCFS